MKNRSVEVAAWLRTLPSVSAVRPVSVRLGRVVYYGAAYEDSAWGRRLYLLGKLPPSTRRRTVYTCGGDLWYLAGYYQHRRTALQQFGKNFSLAVWAGPEAIDRHEAPRPRMAIDITYGE